MRSIGEVAETLDLPQHVLRFWETRFREIDPLKRAGGRRLYRERDIEIVIAIRHLLYSEGYTIKGVQRILKEQGVDSVVAEVLRRMSGDAADSSSGQDGAGGGADVHASDGDVDEAEAETVEAGAFEADTCEANTCEANTCEAEPLTEPEPPPAAPVAEPLAASAPAPAISGAPPRPLNDDDARLLRAALSEIEECRRLLRLTIR